MNTVPLVYHLTRERKLSLYLIFTETLRIHAFLKLWGDGSGLPCPAETLYKENVI